MQVRQVELHGAVFRRKVRVNNFGSDGSNSLVRACDNFNQPQDLFDPTLQTHESYLDYFHQNLCDIGINPTPYGTHSFRRGGCQYLAMSLRWPLCNICTWGGWTKNFDNPTTIFKYLLLHVDTPLMQREDYFNPLHHGIDRCGVCGRSCGCA